MNEEKRAIVTSKVKLYRQRAALLFAIGVFMAAVLSQISPRGEQLGQVSVVAAASEESTVKAPSSPMLLPTNLAINLCAKSGTVAMPDGAPIPIWGLAVGDCTTAGPAQIPGPVLSVVEGGTVDITLYNSLSEPVSLNFPGQGITADTMGAAPGSFTNYSFTAGAAGTHLYESGTNAVVQVPMGLYGAFIVQSASASYDDEAVLVLSEIDPALNANPASFNFLDYAPKYWLINGKAYPDTDAIMASAGTTILLRYVNAGSIHHTMTLLGAHQRVVATDGYPLNYAYDVTALTVPSGQTAETLLTVPTDAVGSQMPLYNRQLHLTNGLPGPDHFVPGGGMMTFVNVMGLNFNDYPLSSYGGAQDGGGAATIEDGGATLHLTGNTWKRIDLPYNVTANTVLEFDFASSAETEIHGIGFDTDDTIDNPIQIFQLYGTQSYGIGVFPDYTGSAPAWQHYSINVGQSFTGAMNYMVFVNDNDAGPIGESLFRNVRVYEQPPLVLQVNGTGYPVEVYDPAQNSGSVVVTVEDGGNTLHIVGNGWRKVGLPYNVTASTVLEFDFSSGAEGEIHGIGLDDDDAITAGRLFQLYGTQVFGIQTFNTYMNGDGTVHFVIDVGSHFTGSMLYVTFANDHDVASPTAESVFSNISLHE